MRDVSITGVGSTTFGKLDGRSGTSLAVEAANAALLRAGVERREIGALYLGNFMSGPLSGQEVLAGLVAEELGLGNIPCTKVEGACASGGIAFRHACLAVASGMTDAALVVGVEKMTHANGAAVTSALNCAMDNEAEGLSGLTFEFALLLLDPAQPGQNRYSDCVLADSGRCCDSHSTGRRIDPYVQVLDRLADQLN